MKLNVLHIIPSISTISGGPAFALNRFIDATREKINHTIYATAEKPLNHYHGTQVKTFPFIGTHSFKYSHQLFKELERSNHHYHLFHIHAGFSLISFLCCRYAISKQIPYIYRPLGTFSPYSLNQGLRLLKQLLLPLEIRNLESAKLVHATSNQEKKDINQLVPKANVKVIPIPYDLISDEKIHNEANNRPFNIGYLSRIHPKKQLEKLLKAVIDLSDSGVNLLCHVAGTGNLGYVEKIRSAFQHDSIRFYGFLEGEEKRRFWELIDLFVLPSKHENFGVAVVEALSYQIPVLITDTTDISDIVQKYNAGIVYNDEKEDLSKLIESLIIDRNKLVEMTKGIPLLFKKALSSKTIGTTLINHYNDVAKS